MRLSKAIFPVRFHILTDPSTEQVSISFLFVGCQSPPVTLVTWPFVLAMFCVYRRLYRQRRSLGQARGSSREMQGDALEQKTIAGLVLYGYYTALARDSNSARKLRVFHVDVRSQKTRCARGQSGVTHTLRYGSPLTKWQSWLPSLSYTCIASRNPGQAREGKHEG